MLILLIPKIVFLDELKSIKNQEINLHQPTKLTNDEIILYGGQTTEQQSIHKEETLGHQNIHKGITKGLNNIHIYETSGHQNIHKGITKGLNNIHIYETLEYQNLHKGITKDLKNSQSEEPFDCQNIKEKATNRQEAVLKKASTFPDKEKVISTDTINEDEVTDVKKEKKATHFYFINTKLR